MAPLAGLLTQRTKCNWASAQRYELVESVNGRGKNSIG